MVAIHRSAHEHGKILGRRGQATVAILAASESPSPSASSNPDAIKPPTNTKALAAVIAVLVVIIFSVIAVWRYQAWKRQRTGAASSLVNTKGGVEEKHINFERPSSFDIEKPTKAYLTSSTDTDAHPGWVPQIRVTHEPAAPARVPTAPTRKPKPIPSLRLAEKVGSQFSGAMPTPPPAYVVANGGVESAPPSPIPIPPNPPTTDATPPTPPTPPANKR
ncbi:hypothetical protein BD779DRAFT_197215 [Infundibulicybe gibba]|nr:hypothetical protein BD779DRAFT_197215 [Infundibulicybe gibba]